MLLMSAQHDRSHTAQIVDMVRLLDAPGRKKDNSVDESRSSVVMLSIRQSLRYQASIGLDDIDTLKVSWPKAQLDEVLAQLRGLLNAEFGRLRVHRYRQAFSVGHHSLEGLIAGLLRVQYFARQIQITGNVEENELMVDPEQRSSPSLGWGVGSTIMEAENERLHRRRSRR